MNEINWMQQGLECPKCGAVMAPHVDCCVNCRGNKGGGTATTSPTMINGDPIFNEPSSICSTREDPETQWERYYMNV
jgi:hypothetical protein